MSDQAARAKAKFWSVPTELKEVRLDSFARRCLPHLSRRIVESAIRDGLFLINGKVGKKGDKLTGGDRLEFKGTEHWLLTAPIPNAQIRVPIVYEDPTLLVVNKPAGISTHGFSGRDTSTLANFLAAERPLIASVGKSRWEHGLVHRLDRETSGLVLVAKTQAAFERLRLQFRRRKIKKTYWALVWGSTAAEGSVSYPLAHDARDKRRMQAVVGAANSQKTLRCWKAFTRFRKLGEAQGLSLLEIEMETGVTHQIRAHLSAIGHPLVGDTLYGADKPDRLDLHRHFLHAGRLEFDHPRHGRAMKLHAELPRELKRALKRLKMKF